MKLNPVGKEIAMPLVFLFGWFGFFFPSVFWFAPSVLLYLAHTALKHIKYIIKPSMTAPGAGT